MTGCDETTPLIDSNPDPPLETRTSAQPHKFYSSQYIILSISTIILVLNISNFIATVPQTVILEDIVCSQYYSSLGNATSGAGSDGERCKIEPVQSEVALLNNLKETFETIPGIILAVPYGALADRIGRKKVLLLGIIGCLLSDIWVRVICWFPRVFPLRAIWLSSMWQIIGGGATTFAPILFVMVADVCSPEKRTVAFSQLQAAVLLSEFLSVPTGASLTSFDPWIPYLGSSVIMFSGICLVVFLIPETFIAKDLKSLDPNDDTTPPLLQDTEPSLSVLRKKIHNLETARLWVQRNIALMLVISCFFVAELARQVTSVLLQYTSKKFHWTYAKASYLVSLRAGVNLLVLVVVIPALSVFFVRQLKMDTVLKDKRLTQSSGICLVTGCLTIFLAEFPMVLILGQTFFALGSAFNVTARSFVTSLVDKNRLGTVYTAISVLTYGGILVGGPLLANSFRWGMKLGGLWIGLPFLVAAGLFMLALMAVSVVKPHLGERSGSHSTSD